MKFAEFEKNGSLLLRATKLVFSMDGKFQAFALVDASCLTKQNAIRDAAKSCVKDFPCAIFKSYPTREEAERRFLAVQQQRILIPLVGMYPILYPNYLLS